MQNQYEKVLTNDEEQHDIAGPVDGTADDFVEVPVAELESDADGPRLETDSDDDGKVTYDEWERLFPSPGAGPRVFKHDVYNLVSKAVLGLGVGAEFVNTDIKNWGFTDPKLVVIPVALAAATFGHGLAENSSPDWQLRHQRAMTVYTVGVAVIKIVGLESFNKAIVLPLMGDRNSVGVKVGSTFAALGMCVPFVAMAQSKDLAKWERLPPRVRGFFGHKVTQKIITVISNGINANAGIGSILGFVAAFNVMPSSGVICQNMTNCTYPDAMNVTINNTTRILITPLQVSVISGAVGVGNMAVEVLTSWQHPLIGFTGYVSGALRIMVTAGAMGTSIVRLGFTVTSGFVGGSVPLTAAYPIGIVSAFVIAGATTYRIQKYLRQPEEEHNDKQVHPARGLLRWFGDCCGRRPKEQEPLLEKPKSSSCTIL